MRAPPIAEKWGCCKRGAFAAQRLTPVSDTINGVRRFHCGVEQEYRGRGGAYRRELPAKLPTLHGEGPVPILVWRTATGTRLVLKHDLTTVESRVSPSFYDNLLIYL